MIVGRRRIKVRDLLRFIDDVGGEWIDLSRKKVVERARGRIKEINLDEYFPSVTTKLLGRLLRMGEVEKIETAEGEVIRLTEKGKKRVLFMKIDNIKPKTGKWDGKWRVVFFDVEECRRLKRDKFRKYLTKMGLRQMQRSVWIGPYDVDDEIKYLRELLEVPHSIKLGLLERVENENELKEWFGMS